MFVVSTNRVSNQIYTWKECATTSGAECVNTLGSYECRCASGYRGDGLVCLDVDECNEMANICPQYATCFNKPGGYVCVCKAGFRTSMLTTSLGADNVSQVQHEDGSKCVDIDECGEGSHECQANSKCVNTLGSYKCVCARGFRGNGAFCQDVDECQLNMDMCADTLSDSVCVNTIGSYACQCKSGFKLENGTCVSEADSPRPTTTMLRQTTLAPPQTTPPLPAHTELTSSCEKQQKQQESTAAAAQYTYCKFRHNCDPNAYCIYDTTKDTYACKCFDEYIGNGFKCYGISSFLLFQYSLILYAFCSVQSISLGFFVFRFKSKTRQSIL